MRRYVWLTWPWRWMARRRWANHTVDCRQCRFVVSATLPPAFLCDEGFRLGKKAHP